ncbi:hypothetical protein PNU98_04135 [[Ruminococcus] gnavus]|nr:hypothetical protein [Mediterraneibacter gnavus]MDB8696964.1 hypothetical protein [Mediterraneibacter gnavus]
MEDLGEEAEFGEDIEYERCEMCGNEKIRYVHIMTHPEFPGELRVGCICACHMTDDYENPEARERDLKNRVQRKKNFMKKEWRQVVRTGNFTLKYKGENITIMRSKYDTGWGVIYAGKWRWDYHGRKISDFDTARLVAFNLFDEMYNSRSEAQPYWDGDRWLYCE